MCENRQDCRRRLARCSGLMCFVSLGLLMSQTVIAEISPRTRETLVRGVVPAYKRGNSIAMLNALSPLVAKLNSGQVSEVDTFLLNADLPTTGSLLVEARLAAMHQGLLNELPRASARETLLILGAIERQSEDQVTLSQQLIKKCDEMQQTFPTFEQAFWEIHVAENEIRNAIQACEYARNLQNAARRINRNQLPEEQAALLDKDYRDQQLALNIAAKQLNEKKLELRIQRLDLSYKTLQESSVTRDRIYAAYLSDLDGDLLQAAYATPAASGFRRALLQQTTAEQIKETASKATEIDPPLTQKCRLFFTGLHWWLRGRYGQGPDGHGLLKSVQALQTPRGQFGLYMPVETPQPTDPMQSQSIPQVDRRHHYIWRYEYRRITPQFANQSASLSKVNSKVLETIKLRRFY